MTELDLSIVVPVFNEAENLRELHREIVAALPTSERSIEILYIDDGSTDASPQVLAELAAADPDIRILRLQRNSGQSAAFAAGFRAAKGAVIATLDADLQNDPQDLPRLLSELETADIVCGIRTDRHDSWLRRASSRIANAVRNRMTGESVTDVGCSLRVFRADLARDLPLFVGMHRFLPTLLRMQGGTLVEVPVRHRPRLHGESKYGIHNRLWVAIADLFAVRWMQRRWIDRRLASETTSGSRSDSRTSPR